MNASFMKRKNLLFVTCKWPALLWPSGVSLHTGLVLDPVYVEGTWYQGSSALFLCVIPFQTLD